MPQYTACEFQGLGQLKATPAVCMTEASATQLAIEHDTAIKCDSQGPFLQDQRLNPFRESTQDTDLRWECLQNVS